ncbi:MAG TPA: hypothetical protein VKS43_00130 [Burkholderiales bacterium]|nr:hypothetical protein [Burkholderiales bacterium]
MAAFNLKRFRDLAFGRAPLPDHPMRSLEEARRMLALLPEDDSESSLADLTRWTVSMNGMEAFTPGRRARVLMLIDDAARTHWRALGARYLAPHGVPTEYRDGDPAILRALYDSASELANGFAITLDASEHSSQWVVENQARLMIRSMRWLGRRLALAHMLQAPHTPALWELLHRRREIAEVRGMAATAMPAFEGVKYSTSVNREYLRALLLELAAPDSVRVRQVELIYRIAARIASTAKLEYGPTSETAFAVIPAGDARPVPVDRFKPGAAAPLYINTVNCLPRLRAALERDMGRNPKDEDSLFGRGFTIHERNTAVARLLEYWGLNPPQRRNRRIPLALAARVVSGFSNVLGVVPTLAGIQSKQGSEASRSALRLLLSETSKSLKRSKVKAARVEPARVIDASAGGLGLAIRHADATWAKHGILLAVMIEPGKDWFVGVLRRIFSIDEELRLGIQILSPKPRKILLYAPTTRDHMVWEEAIRGEKNFEENFRHGILLEPQELPLAAADLLLPPGMVTKGSQFNLPLPSGQQRLSIARLHVDNEFFQRVLVESLGMART